MARSIVPGTIPIRTMSPVRVKKPEGYIVCKDDLAATTIQAVARVFLANKEWERLYIRHIQTEVLRLRNETKSKSKRARKLNFLDQKTTIFQALARGYIVRNEFCRESDRVMQNDGGVGSTLMESIRRRMSIEQRIVTLKQQLSEVRSAKSSSTDNSESNNNDDDEEVSIRTVERLKTRQKKLQIKAKTLEAVTRPLQEKFDAMRTEHDKLRKKYRKLETKNASHKYANETASAIIYPFSMEGMKATTQDRIKAEKRLDILVETSSAYANLGGMNAQDTSAFSDEVTRIGKEAHRKAKLSRDSVRSHKTASNNPTTKPPWSSSRSTTGSDEDEDGSATEATTTDHGRLLRNMIRDRSSIVREQEPILQRKESIYINRTISPTQPIGGGSYNNMPVISNTPRRKLSINPKREDLCIKCGSCGSLIKPERNRSTSPKLKRLDGKFNTPKISNKRTPKISNIPTNITDTSTTSARKPMRRAYSEVFTPVSQFMLQLETTEGMRRVLSEHKIPTKASSPSSSRNTNNKNILVRKDEPKDDSRQPRRKSRDRSGNCGEKNSPKKSLKGKKKDITAKKSKQWWDESPSPDSKTSSEDITVPNNQPRRLKSLNARPTIDVRTNKHTYLRRTSSLSESSKERRRFVDQAIGARGVLPDLI